MNPRPTPEQRATFEAAAHEYDPNFGAKMREVFIAGEFLEKLLKERGYSGAARKAACFRMGRLAFGRETWSAFDIVWNELALSAQEELQKTLAEVRAEETNNGAP
jgi:hypothetical protein